MNNCACALILHKYRTVNTIMVLETTSSSIVNSDKNSKPVINQNEDGNNTPHDHYNPSVREINIPKLSNGSCGFHLSRSKWDPYPWVMFHKILFYNACDNSCIIQTYRYY